MKVFTIIYAGRVLAAFKTWEDAAQVCQLLQNLCQGPCTIVSDTISRGSGHPLLWKSEASQSLIALLELLTGGKS